MADSNEVVVVGGGATGVGVARDLALRGVDVTLCERGGLGAGTTGRSHGLLHSGARYATVDPDGAAECIQENQILREIAGAAVADTGGLFVQLPGDDPDHFDDRVAACRELDLPVEELTGRAAGNLEPALASAVERAFRVPDAVVYPSRLVAATAADARQNGAEIRTHTPVEDVLVEDDGVVGVETADGKLRADHVVNAGGAWAGRLAALADLDVPMAPTKGVMVTVDLPGVGSVVNRCRPPDDGDIAVPHEHTVVLGTTSTRVDDPDDYPTGERPDDPSSHGAAVESILAEGAEMLPAVAASTVESVYWGVRPLYAGADGERGRSATRGFQVFDHAADGRPGMTTVTGGKLTTYRLMAEAVVDAVCDRLGVDAACRTAERILPATDADELDSLVAEFDAAGPADADVVE